MATRPNSTVTSRVPLSRERILRAALVLADTGGIASLTMRKIGQELHVEGMALYKHVANKDELLDGIVDIYANGNASGQAVDAGGLTGQQKAFTISTGQGLVAGMNVLDFIVTINPGKQFSGLRVDGLHGNAGGRSPRPNIGYPLRLPLPAFPPLFAPVDPAPLAKPTTPDQPGVTVTPGS